jgi:hypothetical protein
MMIDHVKDRCLLLIILASLFAMSGWYSYALFYPQLTKIPLAWFLSCTTVAVGTVLNLADPSIVYRLGCVLAAGAIGGVGIVLAASINRGHLRQGVHVLNAGVLGALTAFR